MLEELFNLVKEHATDDVINNPAIPNEQNNEVIASATHSVAEGLQSQLAGGGLQNVLSMFGNAGSAGGGINNPAIQSIIQNFTGKLTNNFGVDSNQASGIAGSLIPNVIKSLVHKTNDPNNSSFDINSIIGSLTGGTQSAGGFDFGSLVSRFTGGNMDANGDGHVGLDDIISKVTSGAQQQQAQAQQGGGGGLFDMIKGFMK